MIPMNEIDLRVIEGNENTITVLEGIIEHTKRQNIRIKSKYQEKPTKLTEQQEVYKNGRA